MRLNGVLRWTLVPAAALLLCLAACGDEEDEDLILPTSASFTANPPMIDPLVFLQESPADTNDGDPLVMVDVMLRPGTGTTFVAFDIELTFDPGVLRVGQIDASATPLGNCDAPAACGPLQCLNNVDSANTTGNLLIGVPAPLCPPVTVSVPTRLLTIGFIGSSVGSSPLTLIDGPGTGDCEILDGGIAPLPIPCNSGGATITVSR